MSGNASGWIARAKLCQDKDSAAAQGGAAQVQGSRPLPQARSSRRALHGRLKGVIVVLKDVDRGPPFGANG